MSAVVFLGPSLDVASAADRLDARFLPPVTRGDLDHAVTEDPHVTAVGIVDGAFFQKLSISPKEILRVLDRGVTVFGSSSMGALRAVECAPYGMVGVGKIFEEYRSGRIDADDEVAIVYDVEHNAALSEPLINMRFAVAAAVDAGVVTRAVADRFLTIAKRLYFPERTMKRVLLLLGREVGGPAIAGLCAFLDGRAPDTKRDDALALLDRMRQHQRAERAA
jgi:hypothetical protein